MFCKKEMKLSMIVAMCRDEVVGALVMYKFFGLMTMVREAGRST